MLSVSWLYRCLESSVCLSHASTNVDVGSGRESPSRYHMGRQCIVEDPSGR